MKHDPISAPSTAAVPHDPLSPEAGFIPAASELSPAAGFAARGPAGGDRALGPALLRGWRQRCPNCGGGPMMDGYLKVRPRCAACGEEFHHHRADDLPAWISLVAVGHVLVALLLAVETAWAPPLWIHFALWPALTLGMTVWVLPRIKGAVVAMQWAWRMHGFDQQG